MSQSWKQSISGKRPSGWSGSKGQKEDGRQKTALSGSRSHRNLASALKYGAEDDPSHGLTTDCAAVFIYCVRLVGIFGSLHIAHLPPSGPRCARAPSYFNEDPSPSSQRFAATQTASQPPAVADRADRGGFPLLDCMLTLY
jgi:hypothetical protein